MPKPVPEPAARRRRERLGELLEALGAARGAKVTQRDFAASIGREQGTVAAILGGHRALGGDVMLAIVQAYGLPADYFDAALRPDPRPFARAAIGKVPTTRLAPRVAAPMTPAAPSVPAPMMPAPMPAQRPAVTVSASAPRPSGAAETFGARDPILRDTLTLLEPDRSVAMALETLSRSGARLDASGWARLAIAAQSAHDRGLLVEWFDRQMPLVESVSRDEESPRMAPIARVTPEVSLPSAPPPRSSRSQRG